MNNDGKYTRTVWRWDEEGRRHPVHLDVYDVLVAFAVTCPAVQHAAKKLLCAGLRGHKDRAKDLREAIKSIERAVELAANAGPDLPAPNYLDIPAPVPREYRGGCAICSDPKCDNPTGKH
jgi:hypothetical protein